MNLLREYIRALIESTEYDDKFKELMDSGPDGIKQAMELADSLGLQPQDLPWDNNSITKYLHDTVGSTQSRPSLINRELAKIGITSKEWAEMGRIEVEDRERELGLREGLHEQKVLAQGMCFPFAIQKAEEWFDDHFTKGGPGRKPKRHPDLNNVGKFKVVHGKVTDKWEKPPKPIVHAWVEMGDLVFDDQTKHTKPDGIPKDVYYDMYQPEVVEEFTAEKALMKCMWEGGEGPWNEELRDTMQQRDARV